MSSKRVNIKRYEKEHVSIFLVTINSNSSVISESEFESQLITVLEKFDEYVIENRDYPRDHTMDIQLSPHIERGGNQGRIHAHIIVEIRHNSNIKLDAAKIKAECPQAWYVNCRYVKGASEVNRVLEYARKNTRRQ